MVALLSIFILTLVLLLISYKLGGEVGHPVFLIIVFWTALTMLSIIGTLGLVTWRYWGIFWIYFSLLLFHVFYSFGNKFYIKSGLSMDVRIKQLTIPSYVKKIYLLLLFLGFCDWGYFVYSNGFNLSNFLSLNSLAAMNNALSVDRYANGSNRSIIQAVFGLARYAATLSGGFSFALAKGKKEKRLYLFAIVPSFLVMLTDSSKAGFISAIFFFLSALLIGYYYANFRWPHFTLKRILFFGLCSFGFIVLLGMAMMLRLGEINIINLAVVEQKFILYAFGNIYAFDLWLSDYYNFVDSMTYGTMTFLGISDAIGLSQRVQGVYTLLNETEGNVFTVFRGIIMDFGIIGGLLFVALQGFILGISVNTLKHTARPLFSAVIAVAIIFFMLYGMIISPWTYRSYIGAMIVFLFYLFLAFRVKLS